MSVIYTLNMFRVASILLIVCSGSRIGRWEICNSRNFIVARRPLNSHFPTWQSSYRPLFTHAPLKWILPWAIGIVVEVKFSSAGFEALLSRALFPIDSLDWWISFEWTIEILNGFRPRTIGWGQWVESRSTLRIVWDIELFIWAEYPSWSTH